MARAAFSLSALLFAAFCVHSAFAADDSPFKDLDLRLDKGGAVYLQLDGRDSYQQWGASIDEFGSLLDPASSSKPESKLVHRFFQGVLAAYRASGLAEVDAYGFSSVRREDGLYSQKTVLRCPPEKASGFLWKAFGRAPESLEGAVSMLPPSASFAAFSCFDAKAFRAALKDALRKELANSALAKLEDSEAEAKAAGFDIDAILESYGGQIAFLVSLDSAHPIPLPIPGAAGALPSLAELPTPGAALFVKVKDDALFKMIGASDPGLKPADRAGAKILEELRKPGLSSALQVSLAQKGSWLFLSSSAVLTDSILAAMDGGPSLASSSAFKRLSKGVEPSGNAFIYYDNSLMREMEKLSPLLKSVSGNLGQASTFMKLSGLDCELFKVARQDSPSLLFLSGNSSRAGAPALGPVQGLLPMAAAAGAVLPSINAAREKSSRSAGNEALRRFDLGLKQYSLDHGGAFPEKSGAEGVEDLRAGGYLKDSELVSKSGVPRPPLRKGEPLKEASLSFVYLGGFKSGDNPDIPVAFDKPGEHSGFANVLFVDGHVQGFALKYGSASEFAKSYVERYGKDLPEDAKRTFLEKALLYEMATGR